MEKWSYLGYKTLGKSCQDDIRFNPGLLRFLQVAFQARSSTIYDIWKAFLVRPLTI